MTIRLVPLGLAALLNGFKLASQHNSLQVLPPLITFMAMCARLAITQLQLTQHSKSHMSLPSYITSNSVRAQLPLLKPQSLQEEVLLQLQPLPQQEPVQTLLQVTLLYLVPGAEVKPLF